MGLPRTCACKFTNEPSALNYPWTYCASRSHVPLHCTRQTVYSQTLENRSSPPPKPVAGLPVDAGGCALWVVVEAETGAALLQPPKSSSCVIAGAPQPGLLGMVCVVLAVVCAGCAGSEEAHASLEPHASMLEKLTAEVCGGAGFGAAGAVGEERLNADFIGGEAMGFDVD